MPRPAASTPPGDADPRVLERARAGEREALDRLLTPYLGRLYLLCLRMLGRPDDARDAAQDALVKIIRGLPAFDGRSRFSTWATRVAMNACLTRLRARARERGRLVAGEATPPDRLVFGSPARARPVGVDNIADDSREPDAAARVQLADDRARVLRALQAVSPEHRAVLVLRDVHGLEYDRIAAVLEVSIGTVKSRLFRARAALREQVEAASPQPSAAEKPGESDRPPDLASDRPTDLPNHQPDETPARSARTA